MTYEDTELVRNALISELERQRRTAEWGAQRLAAIDLELHPLQEQRAEALLARDAALALAEGLEKTLQSYAAKEAVSALDPIEGVDSGNGYTYEDPSDVAFATTTSEPPSKEQTFDHRAPMFINTSRRGLEPEPEPESDETFPPVEETPDVP